MDLVVRSMKFSQTDNYIFSIIYIQLQCVSGFFKNNLGYRETIRTNLNAVDFENHCFGESEELKLETEEAETDSDTQELF